MRSNSIALSRWRPGLNYILLSSQICKKPSMCMSSLKSGFWRFVLYDRTIFSRGRVLLKLLKYQTKPSLAFWIGWYPLKIRFEVWDIVKCCVWAPKRILGFLHFLSCHLYFFSILKLDSIHNFEYHFTPSKLSPMRLCWYWEFKYHR